ncbi:hypothetical protein C8R43DRAFT_1022512 [Mycena crocata]|nr:hypothetical protein C8R43DRAFT_1022512 [Mycena crocata]
MPVQLPPFNNIVNLPNAPQDPPDNHDVRAAHEYVKSTDIAWGNSNLDDESHVAAAVAYEHCIVAAHSGAAAAPPWFADALKEGLKDIQEDIADIKSDIREIRKHSIRCEMLAAKAYNLQCGNGTARKFEPLPFRDGKYPSVQGLPVLDTLDSILALSADDSRAYYRGYRAGVAPVHADRLKAIQQMVGCTAVQ